MLRLNLNWKFIFWMIAISTLILLTVTSVVFQKSVEHIDQEIEQLRNK